MCIRDRSKVVLQVTSQIVAALAGSLNFTETTEIIEQAVTSVTENDHIGIARKSKNQRPTTGKVMK